MGQFNGEAMREKIHLDEMSIPDAAIRLRQSYNQILRLVLIGEIHGFKEGGRWVVDGGSVEQFARQMRRASKGVRPGGSNAA